MPGFILSKINIKRYPVALRATITSNKTHADHLTSLAFRAACVSLTRRGKSHERQGALLRVGKQLPRLRNKFVAAKHNLFCAMAIGQETEVGDALKAGRQSMDEEAADDLIGSKRHAP